MDNFSVEWHDFPALSANLPTEFRPCQGNRRVSNDFHRTPAAPACARPPSPWKWTLRSIQDSASAKMNGFLVLITKFRKCCATLKTFFFVFVKTESKLISPSTVFKSIRTYGSLVNVNRKMNGNERKSIISIKCHEFHIFGLRFVVTLHQIYLFSPMIVRPIFWSAAYWCLPHSENQLNGKWH